MRSLVAAMTSLGLLSMATNAPAAAPGRSQSTQVAALDQNAIRATTHASRGIVKAVSATSLVIASGKKVGEKTFVLTSSTLREGQLTVGGTVSVRYWRDGTTLVATAVSAHPVTNLVHSSHE